MGTTVALGWVHPGEVSSAFMRSVLDFVVSESLRGKQNRYGGFVEITSGPRIASARNNIVEAFLDQLSADWLLMIDADMVFRPEAVDTLLKAADPVLRPVVGGLCFGGGRGGDIFPTIYVMTPEEPCKIIEDYPENALCEVDATGAAFLLMHRDVLEKMRAEYADHPYPWFVEGTIYKNISFGEDWAFCMRVKQMGLPIHVHTGAKTGHIKPHVLDEATFASHRNRRAEIGEEAIKAEHRKQVNG